MVELNAKLPQILKGQAKPANAVEQLVLADLCRQPFKKHYAAAIGFYAEAFAADPRLANNLQSQDRYNAACAAALAAAGKGEDAAKLDAKEQARLRQQALAWLQADLAAWTKVAEKGPAKAKAVVWQKMDHWQKDPDLAGVRDEAALAKLSDNERKAWQKLWADVDALLKRTPSQK
jgi:serine/threonine-protein kinase